MKKQKESNYRPSCNKCRRRVDEYMEENNKYYCMNCKTPTQRKESASFSEIDAEYKRQLALVHRGYNRDV